jgi:hypothetical protein
LELSPAMNPILLTAKYSEDRMNSILTSIQKDNELVKDYKKNRKLLSDKRIDLVEFKNLYSFRSAPDYYDFKLDRFKKVPPFYPQLEETDADKVQDILSRMKPSDPHLVFLYLNSGTPPQYIGNLIGDFGTSDMIKMQETKKPSKILNGNANAGLSPSIYDKNPTSANLNGGADKEKEGLNGQNQGGIGRGEGGSSGHGDWSRPNKYENPAQQVYDIEKVRLPSNIQDDRYKKLVWEKEFLKDQLKDKDKIIEQLKRKQLGEIRDQDLVEEKEEEISNLKAENNKLKMKILKSDIGNNLDNIFSKPESSEQGGMLFEPKKSVLVSNFMSDPETFHVSKRARNIRQENHPRRHAQEEQAGPGSVHE